MAGTSYTTIPSSSYAGLGSQGDLLHSANYGTYDTGIGSITSHPYHSFAAYPTDIHHESSYSNDYLQSTHATDDYLSQHPHPLPSDTYAQQSTYHQDPLSNNYQTPNYDDRSIRPNNHDDNYTNTTTTTTQPSNKTITINHQNQTSHTGTTQHYSAPSDDNQHHQSQPNRVQSDNNISEHHPSSKQPRHQSHPLPQSNLVRSEQQISKQQQQQQANHHRSPSNGRNGYVSETATTKTTNPPPETKSTKSTKMRAAANKQKQEVHEQKQKNGNFPATKKKITPPKSTKSHPPQHPPSDDEESNKEKNSKSNNKKQSHSLTKHHKSRRDDYQTEDNNSSNDEDHNDHHKRSKSKKRNAVSDPHRERYPELPPIRRGRGPPFHDPAFDYPFPPGHPLRERYPYYEDYPPYGPHPYPGRYDHRYRHPYEDNYDVPPYLAAYPDPYDGFFDYEKRKSKSKSKTKKPKEKKDTNHTTDHEDREGITGNETERDEDTRSEQSKKTKNHKHDEKNEHKHRPHGYYDTPYYDERDMLEVWRQERNEYLKKKFKPSVHDVLYAQQWMKTDSYLENQRRRALRDSQGYYFPYKKYTLKDYKDLQKAESLHNPYASVNNVPLDRKERAKKRYEYGSHVEKQAADISGGQNKTPRDMPPKKPWHVSHDDPHDPDKASKRERALEYAKVQTIKHRPSKAPKNRSEASDPTERYVNSLFPQAKEDDEDSVNGRNDKSGDEDDDQ